MEFTKIPQRNVDGDFTETSLPTRLAVKIFTIHFRKVLKPALQDVLEKEGNREGAECCDRYGVKLYTPTPPPPPPPLKETYFEVRPAMDEFSIIYRFLWFSDRLFRCLRSEWTLSTFQIDF